MLNPPTQIRKGDSLFRCRICGEELNSEEEVLSGLCLEHLNLRSENKERFEKLVYITLCNLQEQGLIRDVVIKRNGQGGSGKKEQGE